MEEETAEFNIKRETVIDRGHLLLVEDLKDLLHEAEKFQFHDFKNEKYATPKMELRHALFAIADSITKGKYDN